jgi:ketosteroid isomerase-like protein
MLKPVTLIDEFDDLILKDLKTEGVPEDELEEKMLERKKQITKAYLEELEYRKKEDAKGRPLEEIIKELGLDL